MQKHDFWKDSLCSELSFTQKESILHWFYLWFRDKFHACVLSPEPCTLFSWQVYELVSVELFRVAIAKLDLSMNIAYARKYTCESPNILKCASFPPYCLLLLYLRPRRPNFFHNARPAIIIQNVDRA